MKTPSRIEICLTAMGVARFSSFMESVQPEHLRSIIAVSVPDLCTALCLPTCEASTIAAQQMLKEAKLLLEFHARAEAIALSKEESEKLAAQMRKIKSEEHAAKAAGLN